MPSHCPFERACTDAQNFHVPYFHSGRLKNAISLTDSPILQIDHVDRSFLDLQRIDVFLDQFKVTEKDHVDDA